MSEFDVFENRWTISAIIELETPLRIGGGQNAASYSISTTPVLQTYNAHIQAYEPYIPGSGFKGPLRSTIERLIRTFNEDKSCISVANDKNDKSLCGDCITCGIFGSMKAGAKIRVRDSHLSDKSRSIYGSMKEQPHCATLYDEQNGKFNKRTSIKHIRNRKIKVPLPSMRTEEIVVPGLCFDLQIDVDNADVREIGLILLAIDEFNKKRINIGGGSSRGNGFVKVNNMSIRKKTVNDAFKILESDYNADVLMKEGKKYLKAINTGIDTGRRDFDVYYKAHSEEMLSGGHIVALLKVTTLTHFIMPGAEEETVTSGGIPIIPGSTIKGYFRHGLIDRGIDAIKIKEIFGFTDRASHRSRLLVSDAYCDSLTDPTKIPAGSVLKMWLIFDNMTKEEMSLISDFIKMNKNVVTGKTSSKWNADTKSAQYNTVNMEFESVDIFKASSYLKDI